MELELPAVSVKAEVWDTWEPSVCLGRPPVTWDGTALVLGEAVVQTPAGTQVQVASEDQPTATTATLASTSSQASTTGTDSDVAVVPALDTDLIINITGDPGSVHDVTIQRPIGHYDTDNQATVNFTGHHETVTDRAIAAELWTFTVPNVTIGPDGYTVLTLDTLDVQKTVRTLTDEGDHSLGDALAVVNETLDTNGDGTADKTQGGAPFNPAAPTSLSLSLLGPEATRNQGFLGENLTINATIREYVARRDILGLEGELVAAQPPRDFTFARDDRKIEGFRDWLDRAQEDEVLDVIGVIRLMSISASGGLLAQQPSITMPKATHAVDLEPAPVVAIDARVVTLDGRRMADTKSLEQSPQTERIEQLVQDLETLKRNWSILHPAEPFPGTVILQADRGIDFRVIKKVMFSSAQAGYSNISFAVNKEGD
jgi:biopolymer transport protein ExbD